MCAGVPHDQHVGAGACTTTGSGTAQRVRIVVARDVIRDVADPGRAAARWQRGRRIDCNQLGPVVQAPEARHAYVALDHGKGIARGLLQPRRGIRDRVSLAGLQVCRDRAAQHGKTDHQRDHELDQAQAPNSTAPPGAGSHACTMIVNEAGASSPDCVQLTLIV